MGPLNTFSPVGRTKSASCPSSKGSTERPCAVGSRAGPTWRSECVARLVVLDGRYRHAAKIDNVMSVIKSKGKTQTSQDSERVHRVPRPRQTVENRRALLMLIPETKTFLLVALAIVFDKIYLATGIVVASVIWTLVFGLIIRDEPVPSWVKGVFRLHSRDPSG